MVGLWVYELLIFVKFDEWDFDKCFILELKWYGWNGDFYIVVGKGGLIWYVFIFINFVV